MRPYVWDLWGSPSYRGHKKIIFPLKNKKYEQNARLNMIQARLGGPRISRFLELHLVFPFLSFLFFYLFLSKR